MAGALLALPFTFLVGRRLRGDFAAVGLLVTAVLLNLLVMNYRPLFNGDAGLALVPAPLQSGMFIADLRTATSGASRSPASSAGRLACTGSCGAITESPYGRTLRAMRDNDKVADSLGKNLLSLRTGVLVLGGAIAGLSGGVLVSFISVWSPAAWSYAETIVLFAAVIIGGARQSPRRRARRDPRPGRVRGDRPGSSRTPTRACRRTCCRRCSGWRSGC